MKLVDKSSYFTETYREEMRPLTDCKYESNTGTCVKSLTLDTE